MGTRLHCSTRCESYGLQLNDNDHNTTSENQHQTIRDDNCIIFLCYFYMILHFYSLFLSLWEKKLNLHNLHNYYSKQIKSILNYKMIIRCYNGVDHLALAGPNVR